MKTKILKTKSLLQFFWSMLRYLYSAKLFVLFLTYCILPLLLLLPFASFSQNIGIGAASFTPDASAMLDVNSTNTGMLLPRMTTVQRNAITSPATGLLIFNIDCKTFEFYYLSF